MTGHVGKVKKVEKIAVIGAGIGGLCTAARLAKAGHQVTILKHLIAPAVSAALNLSLIHI